MSIKYFLRSRKLQKEEKYISFLESMDCKKDLENDPLFINDKNKNGDPFTDGDAEKIIGVPDSFRKIKDIYSLDSVCVGKDTFEKTVSLINWLCKNTFYSGMMEYRRVTDYTPKVLEYSYKKPFKNAINCRLRALVFSDCLNLCGIRAYPVCMVSGKGSCHFTCHVYIEEIGKWCAFDPSFRCWFTDIENNLLNAYEIRKLFLDGSEPVIHNYSLNGKNICFEVYKNCFIKQCLSNIGTWADYNIRRKSLKEFKFYDFTTKLPL